MPIAFVVMVVGCLVVLYIEAIFLVAGHAASLD